MKHMQYVGAIWRISMKMCNFRSLLALPHWRRYTLYWWPSSYILLCMASLVCRSCCV